MESKTSVAAITGLSIIIAAISGIKVGGPCDGAADVETAWSGVAKNGDGRVTEAAFVTYFTETEFGQAASTAYGDKYEAYLKGIFGSGWAMMPHKDGTPTLGGHCFKAVAKLPFEFYRNGGDGGFCGTF